MTEQNEKTKQRAESLRLIEITSCQVCPNRMEMHRLYKPYGMMILPESKNIEDFMGRYVCTETDDDKEIIGTGIQKWCSLKTLEQIRRQAQEEERGRILKLLKTAMNHGHVIGWHDTKVGRILDYTLGALPATDFESEITKVIEKLRNKEKKEGPA